MKMFSYKITIPCSSFVCLLVFPPSPCAKVRHKLVGYSLIFGIETCGECGSFKNVKLFL